MDNKDFLKELLSEADVVSKIRQEIERLVVVAPEIKYMMHFEHCHPHHHLDVWEHTLLALSYSANQWKTRLCLLLHDVGKPFSYQQDGEIRHYHGHAETSALMARLLLKRLGFDADFTKEVAEIITRHDTPLTEADILAAPALSRDIFEVQKCDALAHNPQFNQKRLDYIGRIEAIFQRLA